MLINNISESHFNNTISIIIIIIINNFNNNKTSVQSCSKMDNNNNNNNMNVFSFYSVCDPLYGVGGKIHTAYKKKWSINILK